MEKTNIRRSIYKRLSKSLGYTYFKGFTYLVDAVYYKDEYSKTGELLERVAEENNTTFSRVERCIRNYKTQVELENDLFELFQTAPHDKYTNTEFIQNAYDYCMEGELEYV